MFHSPFFFSPFVSRSFLLSPLLFFVFFLPFFRSPAALRTLGSLLSRRDTKRQRIVHCSPACFDYPNDTCIAQLQEYNVVTNREQLCQREAFIG